MRGRVVLVVILFTSIILGANVDDGLWAQNLDVVSPEVSRDGKVTLRLFAPKAKSVALINNGDILDIPFRQQPPFTNDGKGLWTLTLGPLPPGAYRYRFNIDGVEVTDPRNLSTSESNEVTWSLFVVSGAEWQDTNDVPHGAIGEVLYWSSTLNRHRRLHVYTPPGYESGEDAYPILYLLHGALDSDDSWSTVGRAGIILDNLIARGEAVPMVVVMPHGHTGPFRFGMNLNDEFEREFVTDIMPHVEERFRLLEGRGSRAMAGLSMGGYQTLNVGIPEMRSFGALGVFSSGIFGIVGGFGSADATGRAFEETHRPLLEDEELKEDLDLIWFATGKDDFLVETTRATVAMLQRHDFDVIYRETEGGHTWDKWREYLREFASLLFH